MGILAKYVLVFSRWKGKYHYSTYLDIDGPITCLKNIVPIDTVIKRGPKQIVDQWHYMNQYIDYMKLLYGNSGLF